MIVALLLLVLRRVRRVGNDNNADVVLVELVVAVDDTPLGCLRRWYCRRVIRDDDDDDDGDAVAARAGWATRDVTTTLAIIIVMTRTVFVFFCVVWFLFLDVFLILSFVRPRSVGGEYASTSVGAARCGVVERTHVGEEFTSDACSASVLCASINLGERGGAERKKYDTHELTTTWRK